MELTLFCVFLALSLILIILGLTRTEHSELSLIGFVFLFLLSFTLIGQDLNYQTGETTNINYTYDNTTLISELRITNYTYTSFDDDTGMFNTHRSGYWLAIAAAVGFIGVLLGIRRTRRIE